MNTRTHLCVVRGVAQPAVQHGEPLGEELHVQDARHVQRGQEIGPHHEHVERSHVLTKKKKTGERGFRGRDGEGLWGKFKTHARKAE